MFLPPGPHQKFKKASGLPNDRSAQKSPSTKTPWGCNQPAPIGYDSSAAITLPTPGRGLKQGCCPVNLDQS